MLPPDLAKPITRRKPRYALRVIRGGYAPADSSSASALRVMHRVGDLLFAEFMKPRNPGFHRLAHQLGGMLAENLEAFHGIGSHEVLKRLQIEANVGCDEIALNFPGIGPCSYRIPRSLSFESMDEGEFKEAISGMCSYVSRTYWPSVSAEKIEAMADVWVTA
jgi:hypothetical protein